MKSLKELEKEENVIKGYVVQCQNKKTKEIYYTKNGRYSNSIHSAIFKNKKKAERWLDDNQYETHKLLKVEIRIKGELELL